MRCTLPRLEAKKNMNALTTVPPRRPGSERQVVVGWLSVLAALCWGYLLFRAWHMGFSNMFSTPEAGRAPPPAHYRPSELALLYCLWVAMTLAMTLPAATPAVVLFARVNRLYHAVRRPYLATALFVLGYLASWTLFAGAATLVQWTLHDLGALDHAMAVTSSTVAGLLLAAAGVYQWTPAKHACMVPCRAPLAFVLTSWRPGAGGAFRMGAIYGRYCLGCCWLLIALLFAAGAMNLAAAAALAVLVLAERLLPSGAWVATLTGLALVAWGTLLLFP
jgi:predicted metal-binding membrane protein